MRCPKCDSRVVLCAVNDIIGIGCDGNIDCGWFYEITESKLETRLNAEIESLNQAEFMIEDVLAYDPA